MAGCCTLLHASQTPDVIILCCCNCPHRSGHDVPVNLNKTNVIFRSATFYLCMNEKCYTFKGQAWEAEPGEWPIMYISGCS